MARESLNWPDDSGLLRFIKYCNVAILEIQRSYFRLVKYCYSLISYKCIDTRIYEFKYYLLLQTSIYIIIVPPFSKQIFQRISIDSKIFRFKSTNLRPSITAPAAILATISLAPRARPFPPLPKKLRGCGWLTDRPTRDDFFFCLP